MRYEITFRTGLAREALGLLVDEVSAAGPFAVGTPEPKGLDTWLLRIEPHHGGLAVGFAKVAELQLLLARAGEVLLLARTDADDLAVAS